MFRAYSLLNAQGLLLEMVRAPYTVQGTKMNWQYTEDMP